jgi:hypothetical protein
MRPVFCGNFDHDTRQYDLERLFSKYGSISRIDMKTGTRSLFFTCLALKFNREGMPLVSDNNQCTNSACPESNPILNAVPGAWSDSFFLCVCFLVRHEYLYPTSTPS